MRCLLLFPPQWIPLSPHLAGPTIHSILSHAGHDTRLIDINARFYNTVLTADFLRDSVAMARTDFSAHAARYFEQCREVAALKNFPPEFQGHYRRYRAIGQRLMDDQCVAVIDRIESAVAVMRDGEQFYDPPRVEAALRIIRGACDILSATDFPSSIYFLTPSVKIYETIDGLLADCQSMTGNLFRRFFAPRVAEWLQDDPEFIGISIGDYSQLLAGLTLALQIRQVSGARLCIGGNLFGRYTDVLINNPEFFRRFADFVIYNEGEKPVVDLIRHLEGKLPVGQVPNLIHLTADGRIVTSDEAPPLAIEKLDAPMFGDLPASQYFLPSPIYNVQASRSCYWRKCAFCTHHAGSRYAIKPVAQMLAEIRALQESCGAYYVHFIDEAISPAYLRRLSEAILREGIELRFYLYARFEKGFDRELFQLASRAGLRMVQWGFEAASERVYRLMNKGPMADKNARRQVLEAAYESGVWNFLFLMFGFPTETLDEARETVDFMRDNQSLVSHGSGSTFMLLGDSPMLKDLARYSIISVEKVRNGFSFAHRFQASCGMSRAEKLVLEAYKREQWTDFDSRFASSNFREKTFLYVCKYGVEAFSAMSRGRSA